MTKATRIGAVLGMSWRGFPISIYVEHCLPLGASCSTHLLYLTTCDRSLRLGTEHISSDHIPEPLSNTKPASISCAYTSILVRTILYTILVRTVRNTMEAKGLLG